MAVTSVNLDKEVLEKARKKGVNISAVCNEALRRVLENEMSVEEVEARMQKLLDEYVTLEAKLIERLKKKADSVSKEHKELIEKIREYQKKLEDLKRQIEGNEEVFEIVRQVNPNSFESLMDAAKKLREKGYKIGALNIREYFELKQLLE